MFLWGDSQGNATVEYSVSDIWQYNDQISFKDNSLMTGSINPNESVEVIIIFTPKEVTFYDSDITFTTQIAKRVLRLSGQGVEYKLNGNTLPKELDLGKLDFCSLCEFNVIYIMSYSEIVDNLEWLQIRYPRKLLCLLNQSYIERKCLSV